MSKIALYIMFTVLALNANCQTDLDAFFTPSYAYEANNSKHKTKKAEPFPFKFNGDFEAFTKQNLRMPVEALENQIDDRLFVEFIIYKDGTVNNIKIAKGIGFGCDEEAIRVIQLTNNLWRYTKSKTGVTSVKRILPIRFNATGQRK